MYICRIRPIHLLRTVSSTDKPCALLTIRGLFSDHLISPNQHLVSALKSGVETSQSRTRLTPRPKGVVGLHSRPHQGSITQNDATISAKQMDAFHSHRCFVLLNRRGYRTGTCTINNGQMTGEYTGANHTPIWRVTLTGCRLTQGRVPCGVKNQQ